MKLKNNFIGKAYRNLSLKIIHKIEKMLLDLSITKTLTFHQHILLNL
jgi:hypothetical protein